jgi:acyl-CoA reductase-like NAD-dependent aldehyde dehydrogenase
MEELIGGRFDTPRAREGQAVAGRRQLQAVARASGESLGTFESATQADIEAAMERARVAQRAFALLALDERCGHMMRIADVLVDRAEELVGVLSKECGKPKHEALVHEVMLSADLAGYYVRRAARILAPREIDLHLFKHRKSYVHFAPRGVVVIITPADAPVATVLGQTLPALIAGNAVIWKPSEATCASAAKLREVIEKSGLPAGLFQVLLGDGEVGEALIGAGPDKVCFTGRVSTGRRVAARAGEALVPVSLGLSGNAAGIVTEDADVERAARAAVFASFAASGQLCVCMERVYVHRAVHDAFVARVLKLTEALRQGDPGRAPVDVGAMASEERAERVLGFIHSAVGLGADVRIGGKLRREGGGLFIEPTVLTGCTQAMPIMREEVYGPVLPIMRVETDDEAVALANDSKFGLMAYVFTRDKLRGRALAERVRAGTVMVNDVFTAYACPEAPFGGLRQSGYGHTHGDEGLRDMCEVRHVNYNRVPTLKGEPVWFPYRRRSYFTMTRVMRMLMRSGSPMKKVIDLL